MGKEINLLEGGRRKDNKRDRQHLSDACGLNPLLFFTSSCVTVVEFVGVCVCVHASGTSVCPGGSRGGVARGCVMRRVRDLVFGVSVRQNEVG